MRRPRFHHRAALLYQISAVIGRFNLVRDGVCERSLGNVAGVAVFAGPIAKAAFESVRGCLAPDVSLAALTEFAYTAPTWLQKAKSPVTGLEFRRIYPDGSPVAGCSYVAWISGRSQRGMLDADGYMRLSGVPAGADAQVRYLDDPNKHSSIHTVAADDDVNDVMQQATRGAKA